MIKDKTVLVLGVGASSHLSFPTGNQLASIIAQNIGSNPMLVTILRENHRCSEAESKEIAELLLMSDVESPDFLFAKEQTLTEIGKTLIAWTIASYENLNTLMFERQCEDPLYKYIWNHLHTVSKDEFANNNLKVITFNYDRSFEKYIQWQMELAYGYNEQESHEERLKTIPVKHVHGQLGALLPTDGLPKHIYTHSWTGGSETMTGGQIEHFQSIAEQIKIATEASFEDPEFKVAQNWLHEAEAVIFLGCAYHPMNMNNLAVEENLRPPKKIYMCTFRLGRGEIFSGLSFLARLKNKSQQMPDSLSAKNWIEIGNPNHMSMQFMKESVWFDTAVHESRFLKEIVRW